MIFGWLPYFRVRWDEGATRSLVVGEAELIDDSESTWTDRLGRARPRFLTMFRRLPPRDTKTDAHPIYGSLLLTQNADWLSRYTDEVIASIYWLTDSPQRSLPAECFAFYLFDMKNAKEDPADTATFQFKHTVNMASTYSLRVYPPLFIDGFEGPHQVQLDDEATKAMLALLKSDPSDRRAVAVRQYFRTQFNDPFMASQASDIATHCTAIEAAYGIETRTSGRENFVATLTNIYTNGQRRDEFFSGFYVARSLFVHGHNSSKLTRDDRKLADHLAFFESIPWRGRILKALTRDAIHEAFAPQASRPAFPDEPWRMRIPEAPRMLDIALGSDEIWTRAKRLLTRRKAADKIAALDKEQFKDVNTLAWDLAQRFNWSCVREKPTVPCIGAAITTCVLLLVRDEQTPKEIKDQADLLGKAIDANDRDALVNWQWAHGEDWDLGTLAPATRIWVFMTIASSLVVWFGQIKAG